MENLKIHILGKKLHFMGKNYIPDKARVGKLGFQETTI